MNLVTLKGSIGVRMSKNGLLEDLNLRKSKRKHYSEFSIFFFLKEILKYCISMKSAMNLRIKKKIQKIGNRS